MLVVLLHIGILPINQIVDRIFTGVNPEFGQGVLAHLAWVHTAYDYPRDDRHSYYRLLEFFASPGVGENKVTDTWWEILLSL